MDQQLISPSPSPEVNPATAPPEGGGASTAQGQSPKNRKKLIIGIVAGVVVLLLVALIIGLVKNNKKDSGKDALDNLKPGTITGPYVEREHYPRKEIGAAIADATAMELNSSKDFVKTTKGTVIYPACTVVTQADLRTLRLWPSANTAPGVTTMSYVDGSGSGTINFGSTGLPTSEESNECSYSLQDKGVVHINVYQPYLVSSNTINEELAQHYEKAPAISGVSGAELFRKKAASGALATDSEKKTTTYLVRKSPELSFTVDLNDENNRQTNVESLVKAALANLNKLAADPQGAPHPTYKNSPTFKQSYLRACSFMDDEGMKAYSGDPAAASITEKISNSTGVIQFKNLNDNTYYVYVENQCHRISASPGGSPLAAKASLDLNTTTYTNAKGATNAMVSNKDYYKGAVSVPNMGDEAIVFKNNEGENVLIMRKDRFIITLTPDMIRQKQKGLDNQQTFIGAVKPYIDYLLTKLAAS